MADASLRKAETELSLPSLNHCSAGHEAIKEEEGAIVSSLLGVINGRDVATSDVMCDMQENTAALLSSKYTSLSLTAGRSSHEASSSNPPALLPVPAPDELKMDLIQPLESHGFEPLDLGWFI